ncbi:MAG: hypothetical protein C4346_01240 [Chloroflexota bacterium]
MVLGVSRLRLWPRGKMVHPLPAAPARRARPVSPVTTWVEERGEILFEATCDIFGGFPGFAGHGGRLPSSRLRITERYVLVDEREPHGFGLPIAWIEGVVMTSLITHDDPGLRILYRDEFSTRLFSVRLRSGLGGRGGRRAERLRDALLLAGLRPELTARQFPEPAFHLSWEEAAHYESENVIWTGRASAPLRVGLPAVPSEIWLTTRSLIWGSEEDDGLNRLPLPMVSDVLGAQIEDRRGTPAVYVGIGDETTGRFDLPFIFDLLPNADLNFRERGAFLVGLRSRGIPFGTPAPLVQPWRGPIRRPVSAVPAPETTGDLGTTAPVGTPRDQGSRGNPVAAITHQPEHPTIGAMATIEPGEQASLAPHPEPATDQTRQEAAASSVLAVAEAPDGARNHHAPQGTLNTWQAADLVLAEWTAPAQQEQEDDVPVAESWAIVQPREDATASAEPESGQAGTAATAAWAIVRAFEAAALTVFDASRQTPDCQAAGRDIAPPPAAQQAAALAALVDLANMGQLSREELQRRSARLVALGEAAIRLHALLELRDAGHISNEELAKKRAAISSQLVATIAAGEH